MDANRLSDILNISGAVIPLTILMVDNDEDRAFLSEIYIRYRALMYKTAMRYFNSKEDVEDAVSDSVVRMCRYCGTLREVACNKRASYVVRLVENLCRSRYREMKGPSSIRDDSLDRETLENIPGGEDVHGIVFDRIQAADWLDAFEQLSPREKDIFMMRHVDLMEYEDMAATLGMTEGALRTALSRVKKKVERLAAEREGGNRDD